MHICEYGYGLMVDDDGWNVAAAFVKVGLQFGL